MNGTTHEDDIYFLLMGERLPTPPTQLSIARDLYERFTSMNDEDRDIDHITELLIDDNITPGDIQYCIRKLEDYISYARYIKRFQYPDNFSLTGHL